MEFGVEPFKYTWLVGVRCEDRLIVGGELLSVILLTFIITIVVQQSPYLLQSTDIFTIHPQSFLPGDIHY